MGREAQPGAEITVVLGVARRRGCQRTDPLLPPPDPLFFRSRRPCARPKAPTADAALTSLCRWFT